jgi:hypothetical protein
MSCQKWRRSQRRPNGRRALSPNGRFTTIAAGESSLLYQSDVDGLSCSVSLSRRLLGGRGNPLTKTRPAAFARVRGDGDAIGAKEAPVVTKLPQQAIVPPSCIGRGVDPDSRQTVPVAQCAACSHVRACTLLRITGAIEDIARRLNPQDRTPRSYHDGTPARWRQR